jgi:hypothetical protein
MTAGIKECGQAIPALANRIIDDTPVGVAQQPVQIFRIDRVYLDMLDLNRKSIGVVTYLSTYPENLACRSGDKPFVIAYTRTGAFAA